MTKEHINNLKDIDLSAKSGFVLTPYVKDITSRCLVYLNAGFPVHLKGPAGTGKTMLALYIAQIIGKPSTVIFGNEDFNTEDMVGLEYGFRRKLLVDDYIHSVHKSVEDYEQKWMDGRIIDACENGYTLIYDEFTRSKPETNNILLSVLEEKVLELPVGYKENNKLLKVHPEFKAIFTSNPEEYIGVYKSQDALLDRLITIELDFPDLESEVSIAKAKSGMNREKTEKIIAIVRKFREQHKSNFVVSLRDSIKICKVLEVGKISIDPNNSTFRAICEDVLTSGIGIQKAKIHHIKLRDEINSIINSVLKNQG